MKLSEPQKKVIKAVREVKTIKRHKWKTTPSNGLYHPAQDCIKCGLHRQWLGGVWQNWEYWLGAGKETFVRPNCK